MPIRLRLAVLFSIATMVVAAGGGYLLVHSLTNGLRTSLDTGLRSHAATLHQTVTDANAGIDFQDLGNVKLLKPQDAIAQVIDPQGGVVESSQGAGPTAMANRAVQVRARTAPQFITITRGSQHYRVLASAAVRNDGIWTVIVASSLEAADVAVSRVRTALIFGAIIAVVLAGFGAWFLASAALGPVERMRKQAADISEHHARSRLEVPKTHDEIAALGATMNELLDRLQGALVRQRAFVADAGHELRTPLAILRTELELANNPARSRADLIDAITNAGLETDRLGRLAEQLLFLARSDDDQTSHQFDVEPILPLVQRSVQAFQGRADERSVTMTVAGDRAIVAAVHGDGLRRAIDNLLDNALRFSPPGTTVESRVRREGQDVVVEIGDEGPGFPEAFLPHAFERFRRADDARARDDGGTGLGLAIVQSVARHHGGHAAIANRDGGGATVSIRVPAARRAAS